jgi:hypothetical protein
MLSFLTLHSYISIAQTVVIGSGTATNSVTESSPVNIRSRKTVSYIVYTAAELLAGGAIGAGEINELGFYVTNSPVYDIPNYEIQIKHTAAVNANGLASGGFTTVKNIASYSPSAGGWDMLDLDTPFDWDGIQNIAVRICWSRVTPGSDPSGQVRVFDATNGYKFRRNNSAGSACGLTPLFNLDIKPQIRLVFQSETTWTGEINSDWFNNGNWTAGVPNESMDALVPDGVPNDPILISGSAVCKTLTIDGNLTVDETASLQLYGDLLNTGSYIDEGGIIAFLGNVPHNINNSNVMYVGTIHCISSAGVSLIGRKVCVNDEVKISKGVINTNDSLVLRSTADGTARIAEIKTTCVYTISMSDSYGDSWNGAELSVFEEGVFIGSFACIDEASTGVFEIVGGNNFTIEYTSGSFEGENSYEIIDEDGFIIFSDGPSPETGEVYADLAEGCSFSSSITGDITMERYIDEGETYWRYFASAVENPTIQQYLDDFTTSGFEGSPFPDFPFTSIYSYDETRDPFDGYVACESTDEIITVGKGYQVWSGDTITGTDPFVVDLVGPANQGDLVLPVTYTFSGTPSEDGWNLIGNPYASTINWDDDAWTKVNMANAIYIQDPDTKLYATYVAGAGVNGGSKYIASQQSFWVHAIASDPSLIIREGVKSEVDAIFFSAEELSQGMTVQLIGTDKVDEAVVRHVEGALDELEHQIDAEKLWGGWGTQPQISFLNSEEKDLVVHSFDKNNKEWSIPMRAIVFENGTYELKFNQVFELDIPCLILEDTYSGTKYPIEEGEVLSFEMYDTTYAPRFILHLGRNYEITRTNISCHEDLNGEVEIDLDVDEVNYTLISDEYYSEGVVEANPFVVSELPAGDFILTLGDYDDMCGIDNFSFTLSSPAPLSISAEIIAETYGGDASISVDVSGGVSGYTHEWSNGEATPEIYFLDQGEFSLSVTDARECRLDTIFTVGNQLSVAEDLQAETISIFFQPATNQLIINNPEQQPLGVIRLYAINGQLVQSFQLDDSATQTTLTLKSELNTGVYVLYINDEDQSLKFQVY